MNWKLASLEGSNRLCHLRSVCYPLLVAVDDPVLPIFRLGSCSLQTEDVTTCMCFGNLHSHYQHRHAGVEKTLNTYSQANMLLSAEHFRYYLGLQLW